jgi:hypothetical protein
MGSFAARRYHRNEYMERKFHREKKTIELIETLVECIEFWSKLCAIEINIWKRNSTEKKRQ